MGGGFMAVIAEGVSYFVVTEHDSSPHLNSKLGPYHSFQAALDAHSEDLFAVGSGTCEVESSELETVDLASRLYVPDFFLEGLEGDERVWEIRVNGVCFRAGQYGIQAVPT